MVLPKLRSLLVRVFEVLRSKDSAQWRKILNAYTIRGAFGQVELERLTYIRLDR